MRFFMKRNVFVPVVLVTAALLLGGCGSSGGSKNAAGTGARTGIFVGTTDFSSGSYSVIDLADLSVSANLPASSGIIESDHNVAVAGGKIYIINRLGFDNVTVLDTADLTTALNQFSTGNGSNPQDIAVVSETKAYVSLYASNNLLIVDPTQPGGGTPGIVDLSAFAAGDPDGIVEASPMAMAGGYLFVALQRLDRNNFFAPVAGLPALLVVVDTTTDELVDTDPGTPAVDGIVLTGQNPQFMTYDETLGKLIVSETGDYGADDGGIETVDPVTFTAEGIVVGEADLGGDMGDVAIAGAAAGYAVVSYMDASFNFFNSVVAFDPVSGTVTGDLVQDLSFVPSIALDDTGRLFVPDRNVTSPGVRVFDTATNTEITTAPLDVGLPPNVLVVY